MKADSAVGLKVAVFVATLCPALLLAYDLQAGVFASPFRTIIQETGIWSMRLLVAGLMIAPLRDITGWVWPQRLRRMIGLFAAFYAAIHLVAWTRQYGFDWPFLGAELVARTWLTIGFIGLLALLPLAATSASFMHRALGPVWWGRIHRLVYAAALLALVHYMMARGLTRVEVAVDTVLIMVAITWRLRPRAVPRPH